jgi:hypothetical protein
VRPDALFRPPDKVSGDLKNNIARLIMSWTPPK